MYKGIRHQLPGHEVTEEPVTDNAIIKFMFFLQMKNNQCFIAKCLVEQVRRYQKNGSPHETESATDLGPKVYKNVRVIAYGSCLLAPDVAPAAVEKALLLTHFRTPLWCAFVLAWWRPRFPPWPDIV